MRETERETAALSKTAVPTLDLVFELLADRQRRYTLYYLYEQPDGVGTVDDVVDFVTANEDDRCESEDRSAHVRTSLTHIHLPKLAEAGTIEYDSRSEMIRYWKQPALEEWLEHAYHKELG